MPDVSHVLVPADVQDTKTFFAGNLRQFGFIPSFQQLLCAALPEMWLYLTGSASPGVGVGFTISS